MSKMKKQISGMAAALALFFLLSFVTRPSSNFSVHSKNGITIIGALNPSVHPLYLDLTQVKSLIALVGISRKKLVLQFYYLPNGDLTLAIYVGYRNHTGFDAAYDLKLNVVPGSNPLPLPPGFNGVYLGDLEICKQDDQWKKLTGYTTDPNNKYFVFIPKFITYPGTTKETINYEIYLSNSLNATAGGISKMTGTGIVTNPSPPHDGNQ
jgi:hypothetical protein